MRELSAFAIDDPQLALQLQLFYGNRDQLSARQLRFHRNTRHQGHAVSGSDKALDGLGGRRLHPDIEWGLVLLESFHDFRSVRRDDVMRDKRLCSKVSSPYAFRFGQRMIRR